MIIDSIRTHPNFPFDHAFERVNDYIEAQKYWLAVLRSVPGFKESDWHAKLQEPNIKDDMYLGRVIHIINLEDAKEITLQTTSVAADVNMTLTENPPMTPKEMKAQAELFGPGFQLTDIQKNGIPPEQALADSQARFAKAPLEAWVEKTDHFQSDAMNPEGGVLIPVERLVLTSEISARAEPVAVHALSLFLETGPAAARVNEAFPDPE